MPLSKYVFEDVEGIQVQVPRSRAYTWNNANQGVCNKEMLHIHLQRHYQYNAYAVDVPETLEDGVTM
jgi:hypothetical protein